MRSNADVVKLASGDTGPTVFCFSGAGALGLTFLPLAQRLAGSDVYAFQQHGLERRGIPDRSIGAMARRYLALMRALQPHGPYLLVGHSLGGLVAMEIARALAEGDTPVGHLVLLDTYLPRTVSEQAALEFGRLSDAEPGRRRSTLTRLHRALDRRVRRVLPGGIAQLTRVGRRVRAYGAGVLQYRGQRQFDALFDHAMLMSKRHRPRPYDGPTTFVMADGNPDGPAAWAQLLVGDAAFPTLASEHSSLLREPNVAALAELISAAVAPEARE